MSVPAYVNIGLAVAMIAYVFSERPEIKLLFTTLPMLIVLIVVPLIVNKLDRQSVDKVDIRDYKLYKIRELNKLGAGSPVRLSGTVEKASLRWMNRPHFRISDGSGKIGVFMCVAPCEDIKSGDRIEAVGSLRPFGFAKEKKLFGVNVRKIDS